MKPLHKLSRLMYQCASRCEDTIKQTLTLTIPVRSDSRLAKFLTPSMKEEKTDLFCPSVGPGDL